MTPQHPSWPSPKQDSLVSAESPALHEPGVLRFDSDHKPWQRSLRWARPVRDRRLLALGVVLALAVTMLELVGFGLGMRPYRTRATAPQPIRVVLIEAATDLPPPPPEPEPPIVVRASRIAVAPPEVKASPTAPRVTDETDAMRARIGAGGPVAAPQLFNPDGSIRMGDSAPSLPAEPENAREAAKARWTRIEKGGENPLDCRKTRFAQAYAPDESVGGGVARKYLSWVGLYDPHDTERRAARAVEGCDPVR